MRTYFIETWGCQMNHHDSELLEGQLRDAGLELASSPQAADIVLLNTCSVREKPVQKIVSRIGALAAIPDPPTIGVCGCVAQQEGEQLLDRSRHVGFVLGPGQNARLREALRAFDQGHRPVFTGFDSNTDINFHEILRKSSTRGMVTVVEGCNEHCTFCIVPYTRGPEVSREMRDIIDEVSHLARTGLKEIELLGQTINAYSCPVTGAGLANLLEAVAQVPGIERVRFITSHPRHFSDELIDVMARYPKVSRYLHLPVQAGSDVILRRMRRRYTRQEYLSLIDRIRSAVVDVNLSTDIIIGFPGETEQDFRQSLEILETVRFGQVFAFAYSPRPRTPAARYDEAVDESVIKERLQRLFSLSDRISRELNEEIVGTDVRVLIDGPSRKNPDHWQGRGEDNRVVNFPKNGVESVGDIVDVRIERGGPHSLFGSMLNTQTHLPVVVQNSSTHPTAKT